MLTSSSLCLWFIVGTAFLSTVIGQATHTVVMGVAGSFYDPPTIAAQEGDTVTFVFGNGFHGVTQCTFDAPCIYTPGGFNSGLISALNTSEPIQQWSLIITNDSQPIWFFCEATRPQSHCAAGMVGVINPPSIPMFETFQSAAKAVTGTPVPTPTLILTGIGAYATASPSAPPGALPPDATATPSSTSQIATQTVTATPTPVPSKVNVGAVVGGVVGGVASISIIGVLAFCLHRSNRQEREKYESTAAGFGGTTNEPFREQTQYTTYPRPLPPVNQFRQSDYPNNGPPMGTVRNSTIISSPTPQSARVGRQLSLMSSTTNPYFDNVQQQPSSSALPGPYSPQVDVQHLAREVAALMGQQQQQPPQQHQHPSQQQNQSGGRISPSTDATAARHPSGSYTVTNPDCPPVYKS